MSNPNTERDIKTISFGRACRERLGMYLSSDQTEALHLGLREIYVNSLDALTETNAPKGVITIEINSKIHRITVTDDGPEKEAYDFLCQSIPVSSNVQFKVIVLNKDGKSTFAMIVNHMCFDGGDFKYFLKKLAKNYNAILNGENPTDLKQGTRSAEQVYTKLDAADKKVAKGLFKNISAVKDKHVFPLTEPRPDDHTMINIRKIDRDTFLNMKNAGKHLGVTVNDMLLAAYVRALYDISGMRDDETLSIPCMVDLRRHIEGGDEAGGRECDYVLL